MYVCICNPFTDHDVDDYLDTLSAPAKIADVYHGCSGGDKMNCGQCACILKTMVDDHNSRMAVGKLSRQIENVMARETEKA